MNPINLNLPACIQSYLGRKRYLSSVPKRDLSERLVHLLNNSVQLDHESMLELLIAEQPDMFCRLLDVIAETALRNESVVAAQEPDVWNTSRNVMVNPSRDLAEKAAKLKSLIGDSQDILLRFSSYEFMRELVEEGGLFMQSASAYKQQENLSVKDDELQLVMTRFLTDAEASDVVSILGIHSLMSNLKVLNYLVHSPDYLILCFTDKLNFRMISDWNAEAAIVIHQPDEFYQRFKENSKKLSTSSKGLERGKVRYIDPYFSSYAQVQSEDLPFCKHFKFAYQDEFRFVIRNSQSISNEDRKIHLGSLSDIATLVDLR